MPSRIISIHEKELKRFDKVMTKLQDLSYDSYVIFWDDIITAMENRLKVLKR